MCIKDSLTCNRAVNSNEQENLNDLLIQVGKNVRTLRKEKNWTQEQLAEQSGVNDNEVGHIENGYRNITLRTLCRLAGAFQVEPRDLLDTQ